MEKVLSSIIMAALLVSVPVSCSEDSLQATLPEDLSFDQLPHGPIILGDKLDNPYTIENVRDAYVSLYPTKARTDVETSHLYVRFLPKGEQEYVLLERMGLDLVDHPIDYSVIQDGDWYQDPSLRDDEITWQYTVVPRNFRFPDVEHEVLDECFISDESDTKAADGIDWESVERESFRLTGNDTLLEPETKGPKSQPSGRITIVDEHFDGGRPHGIAGVRVRCNTFVKFSHCYTDQDGNYTIPKKFSSKLKYRLVFKNERDFSIGFNLLLVPASTSTLGKGPATGISCTVTRDSDRKLFLRSAVNNAAYGYIGRCDKRDLGLTLPPRDLRIWLFSKLSASSTVMIHHNAVVSQESISRFLGPFRPIISYFAPDITIGTENMYSYADVHRAVCHELAHASHFSQVGTRYWNGYVAYIMDSFVSSGGDTYGKGDGPDHGLCEIGEMWAYYLESLMFQDRYGGPFPQFGTGWWFRPQIFRYLRDRGCPTSSFLAALTPEVTYLDRLESELQQLEPNRMKWIRKAFDRYGNHEE